jgi:hypothetical protein
MGRLEHDLRGNFYGFMSFQYFAQALNPKFKMAFLSGGNICKIAAHVNIIRNLVNHVMHYSTGSGMPNVQKDIYIFPGVW